MLRAPPCTPLRLDEKDLEQTPFLLWPVVIAASALLTLLVLYHFSPPDLDHLVPKGASFVPNYTT